METIGMVSLGCAKNQVNGEQMLSLLQEAGYVITPDPEEAEVLCLYGSGFSLTRYFQLTYPSVPL